jgi:hypothetical protein
MILTYKIFYVIVYRAVPHVRVAPTRLDERLKMNLTLSSSTDEFYDYLYDFRSGLLKFAVDNGFPQLYSAVTRGRDTAAAEIIAELREDIAEKTIIAGHEFMNATGVGVDIESSVDRVRSQYNRYIDMASMIDVYTSANRAAANVTMEELLGHIGEKLRHAESHSHVMVVATASFK